MQTTPRATLEHLSIDRLHTEIAELRGRLEVAEQAVEVRARQQQALASLGMTAIRERDLQKLFEHTAIVVAQTLGVEMCKVLEALPNGLEVLMRAGVGWRDGLVGRATVSTGLHSQAGYTLATDEPVVVDDLRAETRFDGPWLLHEHGVISGLSCIIPGAGERPWGVLGAHTTTHRHFTRDDVAFLQGVANVLAASLQRWQGEESLRKSESRFSGLILSAMDAVVAVDAEQRIVLFNPAAEQIFRCPASEALGTPLDRFIPARYREADRRHVEQFGFTGQSRRMRPLGELKGLRADGEEFPIEASISRVAVGGDKLWTVILRDVTEHKRTEETLRRREESLRYSLKAATAGAWDWDLRTGAIDWSPENYALYDMDPAASPLSYERWLECIHPDDRALVHQAVLDAQENRTPEYRTEFRFVRRDGAVRWMSAVGQVERANDSTPVRMRGLNMDITQRKQAEDQLRRNAETFYNLIQNNPYGIYLVDADLRMLHVSAGSQKLFQKVQPLIGRDLGEVLRTIWPAPFADEALARFRQTLDTGEPYKSPRTIEQRVDLDKIEAYDWQVQRIILPDGRYGVVCYFYDLSERLEYEAALRKSEERKDELLAALHQSDRRKDEFIAVLAHELRNPLAPVRNAVEILRRVGQAEPRLVRARDIIDRQVTHMSRLIDDLLDISRIARGKLALKKERCDLSAIARQTAEDYRPNLEASGLLLVVTTLTESVWVEGDPVRLAQMIGNLLNNSGRFTDRGGHVEVRVERDLENRSATVSVIDTGVGIDAALLPRLFDSFSQADQDLARSKGGLGLGLALTKGLAELHGGGVAVFSEGMKCGATFTIRIPLSIAEYGKKQLRSTSAAGVGLRILVIEDNKDAAETLGDLLELAGHEVRIAFDGGTGVAIAREFLPRVVISDIGLPGELDGYDVARTLRSESAFEGICLIALSGYANDDARRRSREAGFDEHLAKPPEISQLEQKLAEVARG